MGIGLRSRVTALLLAVALPAAALGLKFFGRPYLGDDSPFLFFISALALAAWYGGFLPGLLATGIGAIMVSTFYLPPINPDGTVQIPHALHTVVFIATGLLISVLMEKLHNTEELSSKHREIQRLSSELLTAQERERLRISRELHDDLGGSLTLIKLKIGLIDMNMSESQQPLKTFCRDALTQVDHAIENMRRLSRDLSPAAIETLGLTIALRRLAEDFGAAGKIKIRAAIADLDHLLPVQSGILLYRILQEGLNNIVKHSEASEVKISIGATGDGIHFELEDNGRGLDLEKADRTKKSESSGFGLTIMRERARTLGGSLEVQSLNKAGTKLEFTIPFQSEVV